MPLEQIPFTNYKWEHYSSLHNGPLRSRADSFLAFVDWLALQEYATRQCHGVKCQLLPDIGLGHNHMVRIVQFDDGTRWVARLRLPRLLKSNSDSPGPLDETIGMCEYHTINLVSEMTNIMTPRIHAFEARRHPDVRASFMLMDCLAGNVGMDIHMEIPRQRMEAFLSDLAHIHVQLSTVLLPKIGTIISKDQHGTYQQGPIPGLGGPFDTATGFFQAWAETIQFPMALERMKLASGPYAEDISASVASFPGAIKKLASILSVRDHGPFPLIHGDFGHNNIVVDDGYRILGLIDWEMSFVGPWELLADFPLTISTVPSAIDAPWNYDESGSPKDPELVQRYADQKYYLAAIEREETKIGDSDHHLSRSLGDSERQQMATTMRLYSDGKLAFYSKMVDKFVYVSKLTRSDTP